MSGLPPIIGRTIAVSLALVLIPANHMNGPEGTSLGYFLPDSAQKAGFDLLKLVIDIFCVWLVYGAIKGKKKQPTA